MGGTDFEGETLDPSSYHEYTNSLLHITSLRTLTTPHWLLIWLLVDCQNKTIQSEVIPSILVYQHFCFKDWVSWLLLILVSDTQSALSMKVCKNFAIHNQLDCCKMHFLCKKYKKFILHWSDFPVDNGFRIELPQLQWNISYWKEKDGRLSFETQLKI